MTDAEFGSVVLATAGRDKGRFFLIVEVVDDNFVRIADGDTRKLATPKLKKKKHLKTTETRLDKIAEKLVAGQTVFDKELKSALRVFNG